MAIQLMSPDPMLDDHTAPLPRHDSLQAVLEADCLHRLRTAVAGEFDILKEIGRGGMGIVYLAKEIALDRLVAIKVLPTGGSGDAIERFRREARTAASLSHPNIVPIHAVREDGDLIFFVMKYVEGRALDALLKLTGTLPLPMALSIVQQVGTALHHAHRNGVIHRDIKPGNIMIDVDGWALVADFGIAKVRNSSDITRTGVTVGTPSYMSPEQCSERNITASSDQYSLGILAYQMLTGTIPFTGDSIAAVVTKQLFEAPVPVTDLMPDCPPAVAETVHRMMAKSPDDRWPSIRDAIQELGYNPTLEQSDVRTDLIELVRSSEIPRVQVDKDRLGNAHEISAAPVSKVRKRLRSGAMVAFSTVFGLVAFAAFNPLSDARASAAEEEPPISTLAVTQAQDTTTVEEVTVEQPQPTPVPQDTERPPDPIVQTPTSSERQELDDLVPPPSAPTQGQVRLGTRGLKAVLYVNDQLYGAIGNLLTVPAPAGPIRFSIRIEGCTPWDSLITVPAGDMVRIGYREPTCAGGTTR